jgi:ribose 5-phosphate isomerase B
MVPMKIALGADHAGFGLKEKIKQHLIGRGISLNDHGTDSPASVDYPDYAKVFGIRAANVHTEIEAQLSREHNDANVLTLGERVVEESTALKIVDRWLGTSFLGGRHGQRVDKIKAIEQTEVTK